MPKCKIHLVAGTRPNVMKIAPLYKAMQRHSWCHPRIIFLQQHSSANMGTDLFCQFGIDDVTVLPLAQGDLGERIGGIISAYTQALRDDAPDLVVVPGDVDVSLGAAIAAKREMRTVAHLEAGLRSNDMRMPEELNRVMIDAISDILLAPSEAAAENLVFAESRPRAMVHFVGNIMIDALRSVRDPIVSAQLMKRYDLESKRFAVATFHRPSNVDVAESLEQVVQVLEGLAVGRHIVFPIHPRTQNRLSDKQLQRLQKNERILVIEPMAYAQFVNLVANAEFVVTDSGGIQEETSYLGTPCLTLRETTERPITTIIGTNMLVSFDDVLLHADLLRDRKWPSQTIPLWDGETSHRCAHVFNNWWRGREASLAIQR
jgi:UDP-N-acetylglucosamine 2-epimerase (non-hydrolysing)